MPAPTSTTIGFSSKACHNCRRRRLRCDRSHPSCHKCSLSGDKCLGYGTLLRWANAPAIRGNLAEKTRSQLRGSGVTTSTDEDDPATPTLSHQSLAIVPALVDPLVNRLSRASRLYVHHFGEAVVRDLVSIDQGSHNPFRIMIPLIEQFDYLEAIVVATGALHLATLHKYQGRPVSHELVDALAAKGNAIKLLRIAVDACTPANQTTIITAILFFVNLDLIDSGRGVWKNHIDAAGSLIASLQRQKSQLTPSLVPLADAITHDCLTYRIFGSMINSAEDVAGPIYDDIDVHAMLEAGQAFSYHCCPPVILRSILAASKLGEEMNSSLADKATIHDRIGELVREARSFDVERWVYSIEGLSPRDDLDARIKVAEAHRAAACLYAVLVAFDPEDGELPQTQLDDLVMETFHHLSFVPIDHVHLKATILPTFLAGAQANGEFWRAWCLERLQAVWTKNPFICPWGYIRTAMGMLQEIWTARDQDAKTGAKVNWLRRLKNSQETYLIV